MPDDTDFDFDGFWNKDRERRKDPEERARFDMIRAEFTGLAERNWNTLRAIRRSYDSFARKAKWLLALLLVAQVATGVGVIKAISDNSSETGARIAAIQGQRRQSVLNNCDGQNARHDATIKQLDFELLQAIGGHPDPRASDRQLLAEFARVAKRVPRARVQEIRQSRGFTVLLVQALAPKQVCQAAVKAALAGRPLPAVH